MKHYFTRLWGALFLVLFAGACTSTNAMKTTREVTYVASDAKILIIEPDVELSLLTAAGLQEPRADWTKEGRENVIREIRRTLENSGHELPEHEIDPANSREIQLVRLHQAVGNTILLHRHFHQPLPSKKDKFDWTLGPGIADFAADSDADYALFLFARGSYASAGRQALAIGLAALGGGYIGTGGQAAFASLVDLRTGDIVWFNVATTSSGTDMRKETGAAHLVDALLKNNPLEGAETDS